MFEPARFMTFVHPQQDNIEAASTYSFLEAQKELNILHIRHIRAADTR